MFEYDAGSSIKSFLDVKRCFRRIVQPDQHFHQLVFFLISFRIRLWGNPIASFGLFCPSSCTS